MRQSLTKGFTIGLGLGRRSVGLGAESGDLLVECFLLGLVNPHPVDTPWSITSCEALEGTVIVSSTVT